ncbi:four-helix bundle copper-binding protein [soil metagenome]
MAPAENRVQQMLQTHPSPSPFDRAALLECIQACFECTQSCTSCADACLAEDKVKQLLRCIRLNLDCADVCDTMGRLLLRQSEPDMGLLRTQLQACAEACRVCGAECQQHAEHHEHCRVCAESCRRCEEACNRLLAVA